MRFENPWLLLAIPLVVVFAALALAAIERKVRRLGGFANETVLAASGAWGARARLRERARVLLLSGGLALIAVAAARPQWGRIERGEMRRGASLLIALDVSRSMLAEDVRPNRLERAKVDILDLIGDLHGDRAGLLAFRGKGVMLCPLTSDYAFLRQAVDGVSVESAPRGETDIADALEKSLAALEISGDDNCAIVLISDGEDLAGRAQRAAAKAAERSIPIFAVGIGDPGGTDVPAADGTGVMKFGGREVKSRLEEGTLRELAKTTGGAYIPLATSGTASTTLGAIYRQHLSRLAKKEYEERLENGYVERYQIFLIAGLVLAMLAAGLSAGRLAGVRKAAAVLAVLVLTAQATGAETADEKPVAVGAKMKTRDARTAYNAAVESYLAGDYTNAAAVLLPLTARRDMPEAAELFGAAEFALANDEGIATNLVERIAHLESAAMAFQQSIASGGKKKDAMARNMARASASLPELREQARQAELQAKYGSIPLPVLLQQMMDRQREISAGAAAAATNGNAQARIDACEALAALQREICDKNVLVAKALDEAAKGATNEEARAALTMLRQQMGSALDGTLAALEDVESGAVGKSEQSGVALLQAWMPLAEPPGTLREAMLCETNAITAADKPRWGNAGDGTVALAAMRQYANTFPQWAEERIKQDEQRRAQSGDTNAPSFTQENIEKIMPLLESVLFVMEDSEKFDDDESKRIEGAKESMALLEEIAALMPKDDNEKQNNENQQQSGENEQQDEQQDNQQNDERQKQQTQQDEKEREQEEKQAEEEKPLPEEVAEALRRALQREREHEAEKQKQRREAPLSPNTRDW